MDEGSDFKGFRRKRVSRACDRCRSKKDKCDGLRPSCSTCLASGQTCSYDPTAKKRGLPEGYVRGLEKLWALSLCNIDGLEDTMLALMGTNSDSPATRQKLAKLWTDDAASESLHEAWKTSRLWGQLEKMLSTSDQSADSPSRSQMKEEEKEDEQISLGDSDDWGFRISRDVNSTGPRGSCVLDSGSPRPAKRQRVSSSRSETDRTEADFSNSSPKLPLQSNQLLESYFSRTHPWFPIVLKHNILRASYRYGSDSFQCGKSLPGSGDHAALWAILSYTIVEQSGEPTDVTAGRSGGAQGAVHLSKEYYKIARDLIPSETEQFELGHVQALLLLVLVRIGLEDWSAAWLLIGQAARVIEIMNLASLMENKNSNEVRQQKAVILGCFILDTILAARLSKAPGMRPDDLSLVGRLEVDGLDEWDAWTDSLSSHLSAQPVNPPQSGPLLALSSFNKLADLACILNEAIRIPTPCPHPGVVAQELLTHLTQWDERLPAENRLMTYDAGRSGNTTPLLPHQTYFSLIFTATVVTVTIHLLEGNRSASPPRTALVENMKNVLWRAMTLLTQHVGNFQPCRLPPLFEFALRRLFETVLATKPDLEAVWFPVENWTNLVLQNTYALRSPWPVFASLCRDLEKGPPKRAPQGSLPGPLSGSTPTSEVLLPQYHPEGATQESLYHHPIHGTSGDGTVNRHTYKTEPSKSHQVFHASYGDTRDRRLPIGQTQRHRPNPAQEVTQPLREDIIGSPNVVRTAASGFTPPQLGSGISPISNPIIDSSRALSVERYNNLRESLGYGSVHPFLMDPTSSSPQDLDSILKELAHVDTGSWANNREQDLREFGFIDDNTFQAFCNDPDRLVGTQPLIPPSSSIADIWPPPGFFPEVFQETSEGVQR